MKRKNNFDLHGTSCLAILVVAIFFIAAYLFFVGGVITLLWNWLLVGLFNFPVISWLQGTGIALLLGIVGGFFRGTTTAVKNG